MAGIYGILCYSTIPLWRHVVVGEETEAQRELNNFPKAVEPVHGRVRIQAQLVRLRTHLLYHLQSLTPRLSSVQPAV